MNKNMLSSRQKQQKVKEQKCRELNKSNCQLVDFPIIKLHILQNIQTLNLSRNFISNFSNLEIHSKSSQHVLSRLKHINLSYNQIDRVQLLTPLALTAKNVQYINIQQNPFVCHINYLYDIALIFPEIEVINDGKQIIVNEDIKERMIDHQVKGGIQVELFLKMVLDLTGRISILESGKKRLQKYQQMVQHLKELDKAQSISYKNSILLECIHEFIRFNENINNSSRNQTFRSPQTIKNGQHQIEVISQYQITKSPNYLQRYLTENTQRQVQNLIYFYFREMIEKESIYSRIIEQIQMEEQQINKIQTDRQGSYPLKPFLTYLNNLWKQQFQLTNHYQPKIANYFSPKRNMLSPFKSINTDITSRVISKERNHSSIEAEPIYFGMDEEWTNQTLQFIKHRLLSLIKKLVQNLELKDQEQPFLDEYISPQKSEQQILERSQINRKDISLNSQNQSLKYQTFGNFKQQNLNLQFNSHINQNMLSPKSRNRFILGSSMSIFEKVIKKIIFKRIYQTRAIKQDNILIFEQICDKIGKRSKEYAFRKIFKEALYLQCIFHKLQSNVMKRIFKAWKLIKKRKGKLFKAILRRKHQKESAFCSVFLTQWRITARNMKVQQRMKRAESQIFGKKTSIDQENPILIRSATCKKILPPKKTFLRQNRGSILSNLAMKKTKAHY